MHPELESVSDDYWETTLESSPTFATILGDHRFDDRVEDWSAEGEAREREALLAIRARAAAIEEATLDGGDRVTRALLVDEIDDRVRLIDLAVAELRSDQMSGPVASYLTSAAQLAYPSPEAAAMAVERLRRLPDALDQAAQRFRDAAARGRTPARLSLARSVNMVDAYLASPLDHDPFVGVAGPADWVGEAEWREQLRDVVARVVRPGFDRLRTSLVDDLLPVARADDRAGLCWLDDGDELYAALVATYTGLDVAADEIHRVGLEEIGQRLAAEYAELGGRVFGTDDPSAVMDRLRSDPGLRYTSADEVLEVATAALERARAAMGHWFGRLPLAPCRIEPVPDVIAADVPPAYYFPPSADGARPGTYFVNTHEPHERNRFEAETIAFHEAIPGHHLQLAIASELAGLPAFRRLGTGNTAFVEGWGLYAERLADEMGLYSSDEQRLGMLTADSWRAGRLVADSGLHALGWSRQRAIEWFTANTPVAADTIAVEVDRYVGLPGQAVAYKLGQRHLLALRRRAEAALGDHFDIRGFHDVVLGSGGVTPAVLTTNVEAWIATA
ncbi:MAG TPA: DUF885 domain-containing protein [Acidimicrobiales bacterium]|nr:DUF885 domain-containing protein [Acidimicrobiales bacterium]